MSIGDLGALTRRALVTLALVGAVAAGSASTLAQDADLGALGGEIVSDGSSTVGPLTQAVAEEFNALAPIFASAWCLPTPGN
jgi:ABC-type phosphate transport system substrate-binding protein